MQFLAFELDQIFIFIIVALADLYEILSTENLIRYFCSNQSPQQKNGFSHFCSEKLKTRQTFSGRPLFKNIVF